MSGISKEILRDYIKEQNFTSTNQVLDAMKDMFKDVLQETLEAEMDMTNMMCQKSRPQTAEMGILRKLSSPSLEKWD